MKLYHKPHFLDGILGATSLREAVTFLSLGAAPDAVEVLLCAAHTEEMRTRMSPFDPVNLRDADPGFVCDECWRAAGLLDITNTEVRT